jgi:hypothetical protein
MRTVDSLGVFEEKKAEIRGIYIFYRVVDVSGYVFAT